MINLREMSEAPKIARGKLQGDDKFMALIEVWVDEGNNRFFDFATISSSLLLPLQSYFSYKMA